MPWLAEHLQALSPSDHVGGQFILDLVDEVVQKEMLPRHESTSVSLMAAQMMQVACSFVYLDVRGRCSPHSVHLSETTPVEWRSRRWTSESPARCTVARCGLLATHSEHVAGLSVGYVDEKYRPQDVMDARASR